MPRPTDAQIDEEEDWMFAKIKDARTRAGATYPTDEDVRRAAMVAHFAAALASLRSIPRGAK